MIDKVKQAFIKAIDRINSVDSLLYLLSVMALNRITDWLPEYKYIKPFPFFRITDASGYEVGITVQSYFYIITIHATFILFFNLLMQRSTNEKLLFYIFRWIEIAALFDFLMIYEKGFFHGIQFTDIRILIYFTLYILWKAGK